MLPQASADHYRTQQRLVLAALGLTRREWAGMGADWDASWARLGPRVALVTASAQLGAARSSAAYVPAVLEELGSPVAADGEVVAAAFAGFASDGRPLASLLEQAVIRAKVARSKGLPAEQSLAVGGRALESYVHTQVVDAGRGAASVGIAARPQVGWVRMVSAPCCDRCAILAGKWFKYNDGFERHPQCFPAGVVVSGPATEAATRRWYEGELVVLSTASGQNLPLTGNHPILTSRGWIPANLLREGDDVLRSTRPEGAAALVVPDHDQVPSLIEDVWGALCVRGFERVPSSAEDFHGDGGDGEVDVVRANGALRGHGYGQVAEHVGKRALTIGVELAASLSRQSGAELVDLWGSPHAGGAVGGSGLGSAFGGSHLFGAERAGLAGLASFHACFDQAGGDDIAGNAVLPSQRQFAGAAAVGGGDLRNGKVTTLPRWDAPGYALSVETSEGYASRGRDLLDRLAGQVELDRVVELRRVEWSGHVYSLMTSEGWHVANSLIVSNCSCTHIPSTEDAGEDVGTSPEELFSGGHVRGLSKGQQSALDDGADPSQVVNARRGANGMTTSEGTTRRGVYGGYVRNADGSLRRRPDAEYRRVNGRNRTVDARLTPDAIYRLASDREEALSLLGRYGYLRLG